MLFLWLLWCLLLISSSQLCPFAKSVQGLTAARCSPISHSRCETNNSNNKQQRARNTISGNNKRWATYCGNSLHRLPFARQNQTNFATIFLPLFLLPETFMWCLPTNLESMRQRLKKFTHLHFAKRSKIMKNCCATRGECGMWVSKQLKCLELHTLQHATTTKQLKIQCVECVLQASSATNAYFMQRHVPHTITHPWILALCEEYVGEDARRGKRGISSARKWIKITAASYSWLLNANISCHMSLVNEDL